MCWVSFGIPVTQQARTCPQGNSETLFEHSLLSTQYVFCGQYEGTLQCTLPSGIGSGELSWLYIWGDTKSAWPDFCGRLNQRHSFSALHFTKHILQRRGSLDCAGLYISLDAKLHGMKLVWWSLIMDRYDVKPAHARSCNAEYVPETK